MFRLARYRVAAGLLAATISWGGAAHGASGGPDLFGYSFVDSAEAGGPLLDYEDLSVTGTLATTVSSCDDCLDSAVPIGFSFFYYGTSYTEVTISSNGFITMGIATSSGCCTGGVLPATAAPNATIALWWEDLRPSSGGDIRYATLGTAPNRRFIVDFNQVQHYFSGLPVTMQVKLFEGSNIIEVHYVDAPVDAGTHSAGIEDSTGTDGLQYYRGNQALTPNTAVRYSFCPDDLDGDGAPGCGFDCDDADPNNFPGNPEVYCNGTDEDCDPLNDDPDDDQDGTSICGPDGILNTVDDDCDDGEAGSYPGNPELPCDGLDNDCDGRLVPGEVDDDGDGYLACAECDDTNAGRYPDAPEACDGLDSDCDGLPELEVDLRPLLGNSGQVVSGRLHAMKWQMTDTVPSGFQIQAQLSIDAGEAVTFLVYESTTEDGTYDLLAGDMVRPPATPPSGDWVASNPFNSPLQAGNFYLIGVHAGADQITVWNSLDPPAYSNDAADVLGSYQLTSVAAPSSTAVTGAGGSSYAMGLVAQMSEGADADGDGAFECSDCDDTDPDVFGGAPELCDNLDNDCDGQLGPNELDGDGDGVSECDGDCDNTDSDVYPGSPELCDGRDNDCNGSADAPGGETDGDGDFVLACADCDDTDASTFPGAFEQCDGRDNDCNGLADADPNGEVDADGDGDLSCLDCDDNNPAVFPSNPEVCDQLDNNCNGLADEGLSPDDDGDGFTAVGSCLGSADDCDDDDPNTHPGAAEICDGLDNDCNGGLPPVESDGDGDGFAPCLGDCDDSDPSVSPVAGEDCENGLDDNCNGLVDEAVDNDGDGFDTCVDCNDAAPGINPDTPELCDGVDDNCDGELLEGEEDLDQDGFLACRDDCDDTRASVNPAAEEICDGFDNDCDGLLHEDEGEDNDGDGDGFAECGDCDDTDPTINPGEVDDPCLADVDLNCDGLLPDPDDCDPGTEDDGGGTTDDGCQSCNSEQPGPGGQLGLIAVLLLPGLRRRRLA